MKKTLLAAFLACAACAAQARNFKVTLDIHGQPIARVTGAMPGFGYVDDPRTGGEDVALDYRHSGAWVLKTKKCDDASLEFLKTYSIRALLVLEGTREEMAGVLKRISDRKLGDAIGGFQLGTDPTGGGEAEAQKWRAVVAQIARRFPKTPIGVPTKTARPPMAKLLADQFARVSHLSIDLKDSPAPYKTLKELSKQIAKSKDAALKKCLMWVTGPDRIPGSPEASRDDFRTVAWKIHWLCAAYAVESVDAVLFDGPARPDAFGYTLRYLGQAFRDHPTVMTHGESMTSDAVSAAAESDSPDLDQNFDDMTGGFGGEENMAIVPPPKACAAVAQKKKGDVEYLTLVNGGRDRVCLVFVNTSGEDAKMTVDVKNLKSGNCTYRRMTFDPKTGKVTRTAHGGYAQPGMPFVAKVPANCVETCTFILTSKNYNQAGY